MGLRSEATLREFLFERGNQWFRTMRQDPEKWTAEVWAEVYGFAPRKGEGWASHKDSLHVGKFRGDHDPKDGFHPGNCRNPRERRIIEFILPILSPEKPKRLSITMANTLFGANSGVRPVNWGRLIQEYVEKSIPNIGRKPSFLSPYILHLYQHYGCINEAEEDALTIAEDEVVYKLGQDAEATEPGMEEFSGDPAIPEPPPFVPVPETQERNHSTATPRCRSQPRTSLVGHRLVQFRASGSSFPKSPDGIVPPPEPVLQTGAHHSRREPGPWQLRTRKHSEGGSPSDGSVKDAGTQDGKGTACCTGGTHDARAHSEERGDLEVPGGTGSGAEQSPGVGGSSGRGGQQGASLRPDDGVSRSVIRPADSSNPGKVFSLNEGFA